MRNAIERLFGEWKSRILATGMRITIGTILIVIIAADVLHNIARLSDDTTADEIDDDNTDDQDNDDEDGQILQRNGEKKAVVVKPVETQIIRHNYTA